MLGLPVCARRGRRLGLLLVGALLLAAMLLVVDPCVSLAASFEVNGVDIDATLSADGSLSVVERRAYVFDGSFNGIYWDVPRGTYEGRAIEPTLMSVGVLVGNEALVFTEAYDGVPGTYEQSEEPDRLRLKLYYPGESQRVVFQVCYQLSNLATRWSDTAELYWQYVPADDQSSGEWTDVTATVHLPVPSGEPVNPGKNVRAWAHGPLDGDVVFEGNDVVFRSPGVGSREFLEARIAFPPSWLSDAAGSDQPHLEDILAEEAQWAKEANAKRWQARFIVYGIPGLLGLLGIGMVAFSKLRKKIRLLRSPQADFNDKYYRDVPSNDHPAVLGMLYHNGVIRPTLFTATLMRLTDQGRIALDAVWVDKPAKHKHGKTKRAREWRILQRKDAPTSTGSDTCTGGKAIDDAAYHFLFDVVGDKHKHVIDPTLLGSRGEPYVLSSFFEETAKGWPGAYDSALGKWQDAVRSAYSSREFEKDDDDGFLAAIVILGALALTFILAIAGMLLGTPNGLCSLSLLFCFACVCYAILKDDESASVITYTQEGYELLAKLKALRRWLCDFTRLEEAIPTDVVLWNRLLVMATVLGVAEEVIRQLRKFAPEILENPDLELSGWCMRDLEQDIGLPMVAVPMVAQKSSGEYHSMSSSSTASSHDSSSKGSGGGFSGGGGGGFSGGGRGGAF